MKNDSLAPSHHVVVSFKAVIFREIFLGIMFALAKLILIKTGIKFEVGGMNKKIIGQ